VVARGLGGSACLVTVVSSWLAGVTPHGLALRGLLAALVFWVVGAGVERALGFILSASVPEAPETGSAGRPVQRGQRINLVVGSGEAARDQPAPPVAGEGSGRRAAS